MKYLDMCASEALKEANMGIVIAADGQPLIYDYTIQEGILIAKNLKVYNMVRDRCIDKLGMTIEQFYVEMQQAIERRHRKRKRATMKG